MKKYEYRIYVVKQHFDTAIGGEVKRWALRGRFSSRQKALHKARILSLLNEYSLVDVLEWVGPTDKGLVNDMAKARSKVKCSTRVIWTHQRYDSVFMTQLHLKTSAITRNIGKWRSA
jgi:hypothetical protein